MAHGMRRCWTPENPVLYDVNLRLFAGGELTDSVDSYFGMRKIHVKDGITYLNNNPYYFKLVLDQGVLARRNTDCPPRMRILSGTSA